MNGAGLESGRDAEHRVRAVFWLYWGAQATLQTLLVVWCLIHAYYPWSGIKLLLFRAPRLPSPPFPPTLHHTRSKLAGRTLFITGASRGIGKAIALRAAQDGANIVIAAKTAEPHPKLPGTIFTAAKEGGHSWKIPFSFWESVPHTPPSLSLLLPHQSQLRLLVESVCHVWRIFVMIHNWRMPSTRL